MRKFKKKELCECIHTLKEANRKMHIVSTEERAELLPQCQEMAITVGTAIEQLEGEGTKTVAYLEEYCEEVYLASNSQDQSSWKTSNKRMGKLLNNIENSIRYDLPDSPEVIVFLPYKASMWDALDSVYRAAIQEENYQVIVMPTPYYNINRKDKQLDMHYEGSQFPKDIPITDYNTYDLAKERPDVIFIHNPYDAQNYVTQVPEEYFSSRLVEYTEHLVYIPYFVTKGDKVKDIYCAMPAVQNAWRTFVQSDAVRKVYLSNGANAKKIIAMGSPKFDMVISQQKNPPEMPEAWKEAFSNRKIFLLNTHLNPIINETQKLLDKLHQIFELFREREEAALLWRPHPLSIETAKSMNPQILDDYLRLIEEFKTLPNGVYDESSDVHRAIALSDAYIGDGSSLVTLYGVTGKPIYKFNIKADTNVFAPQKEQILQFVCGVIVNDTLWVSAERHNGLYKVNLSTNKAELVCRFTEEDLLRYELYQKMIHYGNKLILIPWRAKSIAIYDMVNGDMEYITPDYDAIYGLPKFSEAFVHENYVYMFPAVTPNIVRLDLDTKEISYLPECCKDLAQPNKKITIFSGGEYSNEHIWIATTQTNCLVEFSPNDNTYKIHSIGENKAGFRDVAITDDGKKMYLINTDNEVIEWNREQDKTKIIWRDSSNTFSKFHRIVWLKQCLWLIPRDGNGLKKIEVLEDGSFKAKEILPSQNDFLEDERFTVRTNYILQDNNILECSNVRSKLHVIGCDNDTMEEKEISLNKNDVYEMYLEPSIMQGKKYNVHSEEILALELFIKGVLSEKIISSVEAGNEFKALQCNADGSCGMKIWQYVKKNNE